MWLITFPRKNLKRNITDVSINHSCQKSHQGKEACRLSMIISKEIKLTSIRIVVIKFEEVTKEIEIGVSPNAEHEKHALAVPVR